MCPHGQGGLSQCGQGVTFSRFCADVIYELLRFPKFNIGQMYDRITCRQGRGANFSQLCADVFY